MKKPTYLCEGNSLFVVDKPLKYFINLKSIIIATGNIKYDTLLALHKNYLESKRKTLIGAHGKAETKFIWFPLDEAMRQFLEQVLTQPEVTGVKAYILQYPPVQTDYAGDKVPIKVEDVNQLTIGFVTTKSEGGSDMRDFPEADIKMNGNKDVPDDIMVFAPPLNHGQLCPQICE